MTEKNQIFFLKVFLGLSVFLHLLFYNFQPLSFDELLMYDLWTKIGFGRLFEVLLGLEIQGPVFYLMGKTLHQFSNHSLILRLPSLISFFLLIFFFLKFSKEYLAQKLRLVGAIIISLSHPLFVFSSSMRPYLALVLIAFILLIYWMELYLKAPDRKKEILFLALIVLAPLIHPQALALFPLLLFPLLKRKAGLIVFLIMCCFGAWIIVERWQDLMSLMNFNFDLKKILYDFSYPLSGLWAALIFSFILLKAFISVFWQKKAASEIKLMVIFVSYNLILYGLASLIFPGHLAGRHLLIVLVPMVFLVLKNDFQQKSLLTLLVIALIYRSFFDQSITQKSVQFNSSLIAQTALAMAERTPTKEPIIYSCGNCLSYYLPERHQCFGSFLPNEDLFKLKEEYIYIEFLDGGRGCHQNNLMPRVQVRESILVPGAKIYRIKSIR